MSTEYPDILGDLVDARQRFEANGVHYVCDLSPSSICPGETTNLRVWLQNCWDVPVEMGINVQVPPQPQGGFSLAQRHTEVPLEPAEVAEVTIPITCSPAVDVKDYQIGATFGAKYQSRGLFIRSGEHKGQLRDTLLSFETGMALARTTGLGYTARTQARQQLALQVSGPAVRRDPPNVTPTFLSHWTVNDLSLQGRVRKHVNDQRLYLVPRMAREALYVAFVEESQARLEDAGLPLHMGEALLLAKILTHSVNYFMKRPEWQDAILMPAYSLAFRYDLPVGDPVFLVVRADYARIARLACSLSFGMLRHYLRRDPWTIVEQLAVTDLVADRVEHGGVLPAEFLYLPLMLGGLTVSEEVLMPGETLAETLELFAQARQQRDEALAHNSDLTSILDQLLSRAQAAASAR